MNHPLPLLVERLKELVQCSFGPETELTGWSILTGGARKKVFRLDLDRPRQAIVLLVWQNEQDYFNERDNTQSARSDQQAPLLYRANTELLLQNGVRVPAIYHFDCSFSHFPFSFALVEFLTARTFNEWKTDRSPQDVEAVFRRIRDYLSRMHAIRRETYGTLHDDRPKSTPCHHLALDDALSHLDALARDFKEIEQVENLVKQKLETMCHSIAPRDRYSFIHDELGPDEHLLIDDHDEIAIIDVDGCEFWDLEREYAYLQLRFGEQYRWLKREDLDADRMAFYSLCLYLSAAYGHFQLYRQGFPDPEMLRSIYTWNIQRICHSVIGKDTL